MTITRSKDTLWSCSPVSKVLAIALAHVCAGVHDTERPGAVHLHSVGCTAELRQTSRQDDAMLNIVAKGTLARNVAELQF